MQPAESEIQAKITEYWNFRSDSYDAEPHHDVREASEREAWTSDLRALLPPPPADVLDVGTGTGFLSILLAEAGYRVVGIDASEGMLDAARRKSAHLASPPQLDVGDAHTPGVSPASFDAVTSRHLLWTLRDPAGAFAAWREALRPGGVVVAIDSLWFTEEGAGGAARGDAPYAAAWLAHWDELVSAGMPLLRAQSMETVADMLAAAGFVDVRVTRLAAVEGLDERLAEGAERRRLPRYAVVGRRGAV